MVVQPRDVHDVQAILEVCRDAGLHLTFRAAGTSLSGQAVTDGVLVDVARHWKGLRVLDRGRRVAVEPGVIAAHVNAHLAKHRAKIGPDPASINTCMMGGVAANNASGMCCGVEFNAYRTLASMKLVLASGLELDTADPGADDRLRREAPELHAGLAELRDRIRADAGLAGRVRRKFSIKNTCGYGMNAFTDFERPIDILAHVLIGSEGTLGFIAEVTLNTLPDKPLKATALVYFEDLGDAGASIAPLAEAGAAVLEIMDHASMASVAGEMHYDFELRGNCAALLVEFQEDDEAVLARRLASAAEILGRFRLLAPAAFTRDPAARDRCWRMRKGLYPSVGAMRATGTAVIIEDVCVAPPRLADCIRDLQALFGKHGFPDAIIFGHGKDGNLHFVISTDFAHDDEMRRYAALMAELTELIAGKYDGSLKAEHGTGRNIAPFVGREWGADVYAMMWRLKALLDPRDILNPGVILNRDPEVHLKHLKVMPRVSPAVDQCIECGFCEPRCPSRELTSTPRQRIAVMREIERLDALADAHSRRSARRLRREYEYFGEKTCAADGMCATACPVKIDTGELVRELRQANHGAVSKWLARRLARHFGLAARAARTGLAVIHRSGRAGRTAARIGAGFVHWATRGATPRLPGDIPLPLPAGPLPRPKNGGAVGQVVYFPACLTRVMGRLDGEDTEVGLAEAVVSVLEACGYRVLVPKGVERLCCGQPFISKGFGDAGADIASRSVEALWAVSDGGRHTVVCDTSTCSGQINAWEWCLSGENLDRWRQLRLVDFPTFMARTVLPTQPEWPKLRRHAVLHPVCSLMKAGATADLITLAETFAETVTLPEHAGCCGFAGDRGFAVPELTRSATREESAEVKEAVAAAAAAGTETGCYSTCRTCEIGMTAGAGEVYRSIAHLCYDALVR